MSANQWKLGWSSDNVSPVNVLFTMKELRDAINSGSNTTAGRDGLSYELLKHLGDDVLD